MSTPARLSVLAGPTAVGKGTVVKALRNKHPELVVSVSATTRAPRLGEVDGKDYFFVSEDQFQDMIDRGEMLEWATVHQVHRYGTPRGPVQAALDSGKPVLLEIDLDGARQVRHSMPQAHLIFLAPPSWEELVNRLVGRGTEDEAERTRRLETARVEMAAESEFDTTVINDQVDETAATLAHLIGLE